MWVNVVKEEVSREKSEDRDGDVLTVHTSRLIPPELFMGGKVGKERTTHIPFSTMKEALRPGTGVYTCNPSTLGAEAGGLLV